MTTPESEGGTLDGKRGFLDGLFSRKWSGFILRIVLPAVLAVVLFVLVIFLVLIPSAESELLQGKKQTTQELTRAAVSILNEYYALETAGRMSREQAQTEAVERIKLLRWGDEGKDYFWITDMHPTMIMHPYLPELDGQDLTGYEDQRGKKLFVAFVDAVRQNGSGFVDYYWQWKDDPNRIVPKLSYVELFVPWQWVIGTGIYVEDVNSAIARFQRNLSYISLAIIVAVALLLLYGARGSLKIEKRRALAEQALKESHEKYQALAAAATESMVMALDGKCAYSNQPFQDMLGYEPQELVDLKLSLLLMNETPEDRQVIGYVESVAAGGWAASKSEMASTEARLRGKDARPIDILLTVTPISLAGKDGVILIARSLTAQKAMEAAFDETRRQFRTMSDTLNLGVFRSVWGRKASLLEANPAMRNILHMPLAADLIGNDWLDLIIDPDERAALVDRLNKDRVLQDYRVGLRRRDGGRTDVSLFAVLVEDENGLPRFCDGILEDITRQTRGEEEREALIAQLQTSLFYLREPVTRAISPVISLDMNETVRRAATVMTKNRLGAILVTGPDADVIGIITDHDFRERVVAENLDYGSSLRSIMTAPVDSIFAEAPVYDALFKMQERNVEHLAVLDDSGKPTGLIRLRDLIQYQQSSSVIISDSIGRARSLDDIAEAHDRLPDLVTAVVDSGADTRYVNRIVSGVSDAVLQRLLAMGIEKLGPAPVQFAYLALGSEGREEQTLLTDQDNALLYDDPPEDKAVETSEYFLALGTLVSDWLNDVGYTYCDGGVMAKNPRWNLSRAAWRQQFIHWIHNADPQELLELNMLFDFRCVGGQPHLARELRTWVLEQMESYPLFFIHFAQNALLYKPPVGLLGNLQTTSSGEGAKTISLKEALLPVVNFARLYALRHRIDSTNTLDRMAELRERGVLSSEAYEEIVPDYETLMRIRLRRQAMAIGENRKPTNLVSPADLTSAEEARLKRLFALATDLRKKMSYDFLGGIAGF
jgi:PAS domain S-box-containing protein